MLNKKLLMSISNIKELYQELKFTSVGAASNKNIFKYISTNDKSKVSNKLAIYENGAEINQNLFALNIANNSEYNINGNLEKFPSVNFYSCRWLETVELPEIMWNYIRNNYETNVCNCFYSCTNLTTSPNIPDSVIDMSGCFSYCTNLTTISNIPNSVTDMSSCFQHCNNLTTPPNIPDSVIDISNCFFYCTKLTGNLNIYSNEITNVYKCFGNHYTNKPLNVYIHVPSNTYNTFLNDTSHDGSGWQLGVPKLGITLKDINNKTNSSFSVYIDSSLSKIATIYCDFGGFYNKQNDDYPPKLNKINYDTLYTYDCNIGDKFTLSGSGTLSLFAPERGVVGFYTIANSNCTIEYGYFGACVITVTGENSMYNGYTNGSY